MFTPTLVPWDQIAVLDGANLPCIVGNVATPLSRNDQYLRSMPWLPNRGQGDLRLTREGGGRMVLRVDRVEIGNSGYDGSSPQNYDQVNRD
jgi:hypothetical protein